MRHHPSHLQNYTCADYRKRFTSHQLRVCCTQKSGLILKSHMKKTYYFAYYHHVDLHKNNLLPHSKLPLKNVEIFRMLSKKFTFQIHSYHQFLFRRFSSFWQSNSTAFDYDFQFKSHHNVQQTYISEGAGALSLIVIPQPNI